MLLVRASPQTLRAFTASLVLGQNGGRPADGETTRLPEAPDVKALRSRFDEQIEILLFGSDRFD